MKRPKILIATNITAYVEWLSQLLNSNYDLNWEIPQKLVVNRSDTSVDLLLFIPGAGNWKFIDDLLAVYQTTPMVIISQDAKPEEVAHAFRKGIKDFLIKPDQNQVKEIISRILTAQPETQSFEVSQILQRIASIFRFPKNLKEVEAPVNSYANLYFNSNSLSSSTANPLKEKFEYQETEQMDLIIHANLMGNFEININGKILKDFPSRKGQGILSYLLFHYPKPIPKEVLMETFWPKVPSSSSRNSLNVALHGLRKVFEAYLPIGEMLCYKKGAYCINPELEIIIDVKEFQARWKKAQSIERSTGILSAIACYEKAIGYYSGPLLKNDLYSDWIQRERDNLQETYLAILERLIDYRMEVEEYTIAHHYGEQALRLDSCREHIHRQLMIALYKNGRRNKAIRQYQACCEALKEELDISPAPRTRALFEKIKSNQHVDPAFI